MAEAEDALKAVQWREDRKWRLAKDLLILPASELPERLLKDIFPDGTTTEGRYGIQRKKVRSFPKIVNQNVVDVLRAFGEDGATYQEVFEHFLRRRDLNRETFDGDLRNVVGALIHCNFLVDGGEDARSSAESVEPSFHYGDRWLSFIVKKNAYCMVDSEIYQVEHVSTGELRGLKIMQKTFPNREMREKISRRLQHEFSVMEGIDHPNVVTLWEHGTHRGRTYGILDWVDGPPVRTYAYGSSQRPADEALMELALQCVDALEAVHQAGYLHGDVHTGNFLVKDDRVCLIDFGLSRPIEIKKGEETRFTEGGVIFYMPPEYVRMTFDKQRGLWGSVAGEVYSCGVILYALFTRGYPYRWRFYREEYMKSILNDPPLSFQERGRTAWPELEQVLLRALAKESKDRFRSMAEFSKALRRVPIPER